MNRSIRGVGAFCVLASAFIVAACAGTPVTTPAASVAQRPSAEPAKSVAATESASATTAPATPTIAAATAVVTPDAPATRNPSAGYTDLPGWLVFEHFGQSPDGSTPEFDFDNRMIWMVHADGSDLHELDPGMPAAGKASPDISPDGRTISFNTWSEPIQIWTAPIDGGDPTLVTTDCGGFQYDCVEGEPSYSGDGTKLAFVRQWVKNSVTSTAIGVRDLASGAVTMLDSTRTDFGIGYVTQPSFSPDGTQIVYYKAAQKRSDEHITDARLYVVNADGLGLRELPRPDGKWAADPDWSPDGKSIVFGALPNREGEGWADPPNDGGIWTTSPDGTNLVAVCDGCLASPAGPVQGAAPSWTSDGRILFWGFKSWALMNADGSDAAHINQPKLTWNGDGLGYNYAAFLQPTP